MTEIVVTGPLRRIDVVKHEGPIHPGTGTDQSVHSPTGQPGQEVSTREFRQRGLQDRAVEILAERYGKTDLADAHNAAWISPDGELLGDLADHQGSAIDVMEELGLNYQDREDVAVDLMKRMGFIRLNISAGPVNIVGLDIVEPITSGQKRAILNIEAMYPESTSEQLTGTTWAIDAESGDGEFWYSTDKRQGFARLGIVERHEAPIHPGTGTDQSVHAGDRLSDSEMRARLTVYMRENWPEIDEAAGAGWMDRAGRLYSIDDLYMGDTHWTSGLDALDKSGIWSDWETAQARQITTDEFNPASVLVDLGFVRWRAHSRSNTLVFEMSGQRRISHQQKQRMQIEAASIFNIGWDVEIVPLYGGIGVPDVYQGEEAKEFLGLTDRHEAPIHPGTGTDQQVHAGGVALAPDPDLDPPFSVPGRRGIRESLQHLTDFFLEKLEDVGDDYRDEAAFIRDEVQPFDILDIGSQATLRLFISPSGKVYRVEDHDPVANRLWLLAEEAGLVPKSLDYEAVGDFMQRNTGNWNGAAKDVMLMLGFTRGTVQQNILSFETVTPTSRATKRVIGQMMDMAEAETINPSTYLDVNTLLMGFDVDVPDVHGLAGDRAVRAWINRHLLERHGDHEGQQGTPEGGSQPGYTHVPGSVPGEGDPEGGADGAGHGAGDILAVDANYFGTEEDALVKLLEWNAEEEAWSVEIISGPEAGARYDNELGVVDLWEPDEQMVDDWTLPGGEHLEARAVSVFGETADYHEAGYILQDGTMLDFSGKREGGMAGTRAMDHREVGRAFVDDDYQTRDDDYRSGTDQMIYFMNETGAVRVSVIGDPPDTALDIARVPTNSQWRVISDMASISERIFGDITDPVTGHTEWRTPPGDEEFHDRVLAQLKAHAAMLLERHLVLRMVLRHGDHIGQEGTPEGGSQPGYTHVPGSVESGDPQLTGESWYNWQDRNIEHLPKTMGLSVPEGMDYRPGRWLGLHSEGAGDVFRELALSLDDRRIDWSYIEEKLRRIEGDLESPRDRALFLWGELSSQDEQTRQQLIDLWNSPPASMPSPLFMAKLLNINVLGRNEDRIRSSIQDIRNLKPQPELPPEIKSAIGTILHSIRRALR